MAFIHKDIDREIMIKVDDKTLSSMCQVNKSNRKICRDKNFWMQRVAYFYNISIRNVTLLEDFYEIYGMDLYVYLSKSPKNTIKWMLELILEDYNNLTDDQIFLSLSKLYPDESPISYSKFLELSNMLL